MEKNKSFKKLKTCLSDFDRKCSSILSPSYSNQITFANKIRMSYKRKPSSIKLQKIPKLKTISLQGIEKKTNLMIIGNKDCIKNKKNIWLTKLKVYKGSQGKNTEKSCFFSRLNTVKINEEVVKYNNVCHTEEDFSENDSFEILESRFKYMI